MRWSMGCVVMWGCVEVTWWGFRQIFGGLGSFDETFSGGSGSFDETFSLRLRVFRDLQDGNSGDHGNWLWEAVASFPIHVWLVLVGDSCLAGPWCSIKIPFLGRLKLGEMMEWFWNRCKLVFQQISSSLSKSQIFQAQLTKFNRSSIPHLATP